MSPSVWLTSPTRWQDSEQDSEFRLSLAESPLRLPRDAAPPLWLVASQLFHFRLDERYPGEWKVATDGYIYTLSEDEELRSELISWHWHPISRPDTHLHVGQGHPEISRLEGMHVPSGRVFLEQVLLFAIDEFGVRCRRDDWQEVLGQNLDRVERFSTWGGRTIPPDLE